MAVLPGCPGLKVEVVVGNTPLEEYDGNGDEDSQPNTAFKYVEAITGADFAVQYYFDETFRTSYGVQISTKLDGKVMSKRNIRKAHLVKMEGFTVSSTRSCMGGEWYKNGFQFSEISQAADSGRDVNTTLKKTLDMTGDIILEFHFIKNIKVTKTSRTDTNQAPPTLGTIPEKALVVSGLSHTTSFAAPVKMKPRSSSCKLVAREDRPFARFVFKYRSLARLKEMWVIREPLTPTPPIDMSTPTPALTPMATRTRAPQQETSTTEVDTLEGLSKEELLMILRFRASKNNAVPNIKRERPNVDEDEISLVEERVPKHRRLLPNNDDEVIELD